MNIFEANGGLATNPNVKPLVENASLSVGRPMPDCHRGDTSIEETGPSQDNSMPVYSSCAVFNPSGSTDKLVFQVSSLPNASIRLPNAYCIGETEYLSTCIEETEPTQENTKCVCGSSTFFRITNSKEEAVYGRFMPDYKMLSSETSFLSHLPFSVTTDIELADFEGHLAGSEKGDPGVTDVPVDLVPVATNNNSCTCVEQMTATSFEKQTDQEVTDEQEIISEGQSDDSVCDGNEDQNSSLSLVSSIDSQPDSGFPRSLGSSLEHSSLDHSSLDPTFTSIHDSSPPSKKKRRGKKKS